MEDHSAKPLNTATGFRVLVAVAKTHTSPIIPETTLQLCLRMPLSYQVRSGICLKIVVPSPTLAASEVMLDKVHAYLVKIINIATDDKANRYEETLGTACFRHRDDWVLPGRDIENGMVVRTAHLRVFGGQPEGEMASCLLDMMQVQVSRTVP